VSVNAAVDGVTVTGVKIVGAYVVSVIAAVDGVTVTAPLAVTVGA
jgi:hypothetical protein